jgi:N-acyl-D-amino-acid deacylase
MRALTAEAVRTGAIGVSTSHVFAHRFRDGRPAPSLQSGEEELLALAAGLKDAGRGVFEISPDVEASDAEQYRLLRRIAQTSGRPVSFLFVQRGPEGQWREMFRYLEEGARAGLQIRAQVMPRPTGGLLGLELSYRPFSILVNALACLSEASGAYPALRV